MRCATPPIDRHHVLELEPTRCELCEDERSTLLATTQDFEYETSDQDFHFVTCSECGHVYMNPRPKRSDICILYPAHYYSYQAHEGFLSQLLIRIKTMIVKRRIQTLVEGVDGNGAILEIGCGDGTNLLTIKEFRPDIQLIGIDLHFAPFHKEQLLNAGIRLIENAFEDVVLETQVDLVIMNQLIEHLWDLRKGVAKIRELLKPGGRVSLSTPNADGYDREWFKDLWGGYHAPRHLNLFSKKTISRFLKKYDLDILDCINLLAPLIWVTSIHNYLKSKNVNVYRIFTYTNLPALAFFCLLDLVLIRMGRKTSNMQIIAVRK